MHKEEVSLHPHTDWKIRKRIHPLPPNYFSLGEGFVTRLEKILDMENVVSAEEDGTCMLNEGHHAPKRDRQVYPRRWWVLLSYCILNIFNAMIWTTFVSVSDIAQHYFGPSKSFYSSITGVNMLANIQLALGVFGGIFAFWITKHQRPRRTMLLAAIVTIASTIFKLFGAIFYNSLSIPSVYALMMVGQGLSGFIQPSITNFPASLSSIWFPVEERDVSTSIASMCSAVGSAIGSLVPPFLVTETENPDGTFEVHGMVNLMIFQLVTHVFALVVVYVGFLDAPPTSPSHSEQLKSVDEKVALDTVESRDLVAEEQRHPRSRMEDLKILLRDLQALATNVNYVILMLCFALGVGLFNALITVLNQFVKPLGYSNTAAGLFGAVFIVGGLFGAVVMAYLMQRTKDYRILAKSGIIVSNFMLIILLAILYRDNFGPVAVMFFVFGFVTVPLIPLVVENCAEIAYPVPEHISFGLLMILNIGTSLGLSFAFQGVIAVDAWGPPPWRPINLLLYGVYLLLTLVIVFFYHGQYKRTVLDVDFVPGILSLSHGSTAQPARREEGDDNAEDLDINGIELVPSSE